MWPWKTKTPLDMAREKLEGMNRAGHLPGFFNALPAPFPKVAEDASEEDRKAAIDKLLTDAASHLEVSRILLVELALPTMEQFAATTGVQSRNTAQWVLLVAALTFGVTCFGVWLTCHQQLRPQPHTPAPVTNAPAAIAPTTTQAARPDR